MTDDEKWLRFYQVDKNPGETLEDYKTRMTPELMNKCPKCDGMKWLSKRKCTDCVAGYQKEYRKNNKEKVAETRHRWIEKNRERYNEKKRKWRENNLERCKAHEKKYRQNHKEKMQEIQRRYRETHLENRKKWIDANRDKINRMYREWYHRRKNQK